jgi:hypothetical protein
MASPEQPTEEFDPVTAREITLAYLERARELWLPHYHRAERAGGNSAEANRDASDAFKPIDRLLDELGTFVTAQAIESQA